MASHSRGPPTKVRWNSGFAHSNVVEVVNGSRKGEKCLATGSLGRNTHFSQMTTSFSCLTAETNMESFRVHLDKETLVFSAAHFITFNGDVCERLHGHNWRVRCDVVGPLDENRYVFDFIALRDALQSIVNEMDHRMLLPDSHPQIKVVASEREVEATFDDRRWVFPREDCLILPMPNTTAEEISRYIARRLARLLGPEKLRLISEMEIGVDENRGQWAVYRNSPEALLKVEEPLGS